PDLRGLCVSEYLLKESIKSVNKDKDISCSFRDYPCYRHLKQQLFRRFRLIAENNLTKDEVERKSAILSEAFAVPADRAINKMKELSLRCRIFDFLRQTSLFMTMLENGSINFKHIKYILVDDFDELSYSAQHFIRHVADDAQEFYIAAAPEGGARRGYLCANPQGYEEIKRVKKAQIVRLNHNEEAPATADDAQKLFVSVKTGVVDELDTIKLVDNSVRHIEMMEHFFARLKILLFNEKIPPEEITIVSPNLNSGTIHRLKDFFRKENIDYQIFSGSKRFMDDEFIYGTVILLQLINKNWKLPPKTGEIRTLFTGILGFPVVYCEDLFGYYTNKGALKPDITFELQELNEKYRKLIALINEASEQNLPINKQAEKIFDLLLAERLKQGRADNLSFENFREMMESLESFRKIAAKTANKTNIERDWIVLVKDTVVSDNPATAEEVKIGCVKVATPQKVVDLELSSRFQLWLDVSSPVWFKEDTGPLYNSWVFQKVWTKEEYTPQLHRELTAEKTACLLRKLALCAKDKILCFASQLDESNNENNG
ncbi:MAG: hypothetical protein GX568_08115, partial [Candidatus Gastranaerophilales bacterium]|nr:hypothetical protein [Candidatus Gastranaerophilales bacterium]